MNFTKLTNYIDSLEETLHIPSCDIAVYQNHNNIYRHMAGYQNILTKTPITGNELYFLYSCTKVSTCTAALQLIQEGKIGLDDNVCNYLPEFEHMMIKSNNGLTEAKNPIKIKHLFTMTAGLTYDLATKNIKEASKNPNASTRDIVKAIAKDPLIFEPGTHYNYSLCHDVLAAVVEEVSQMSFGEYLKKYLFYPLGMTRTTFVPNKEVLDNMAAQIIYKNGEGYSDHGLFNVFIPTKKYESGGAGLISCVDDYIKLIDALANDGISADGYSVLSKESIDLMKTNYMSGDCKADFDTLNKKGYGYGLGVRTLITKEYGAKSPLGEFGWDGAACSYCLADNENNIAIFYAQHTFGDFGFVYETVHPTIRDLVYESLGF